MHDTTKYFCAVHGLECTIGPIVDGVAQVYCRECARGAAPDNKVATSKGPESLQK